MPDDALLSRIEDAGLNASAPPQQRWVDGWLLRLAPAKAKRARCVNAVAEGRLPLDEKLARAEAACRAAGIPLIFRITPYTRPAGLDEALEARGWPRFDDTRVMVCTDLAGALAAAAAGAPPRVDGVLRSLAPAAFAEAVGSLRGTPAALRATHVERLLASPVPYRAWAWTTGDVVLACGQHAMEDDLVGLYDVHTADSHRGQGLARSLCLHLLADAARRGARHAYLQVDAGNAAARAVYARLGFVDGYAYHYRGQDAAAG